MASDIDLEHTAAPGTAPATRIPCAVWINRPRSEPRGTTRAAKAIAAAIVLGLVAVAATHTATERLAVAPSVIAGTDGGRAGDDPTGCFPDPFDRRGLAPVEQPATF